MIKSITEVDEMSKHELKIYMEQGAFNVGCVGAKYSEEELRSSPQGENRKKVSEILKKLNAKYKEQINISIHDPRNITSMPANIKHNIKSSKPAWILDGKKIFEKVPEWTDLVTEINRVIN